MSAHFPTGVAVAGDACIDVYVDSGPSLSTVGGNAANVAVNIVRRGKPAAFFGVVGDDRNGERIRLALAEQGVALPGLRAVNGPSWVAQIVRDEAGVASVLSEDPGIAGPYLPTRAELDELAGYEHVHLANLADPALTLEALAERSVSTSYDFGASDDVARARVGVAFFSRPDSEPFAAARLGERAVREGTQLAIVTLGASGFVAVDHARTVSLAAERIDPVDTLGAGDSLIAAFLVDWLAKRSLKAAMKTARRDASRTCLHLGAWPQEPVHFELPVRR